MDRLRQEDAPQRQQHEEGLAAVEVTADPRGNVRRLLFALQHLPFALGQWLPLEAIAELDTEVDQNDESNHVHFQRDASDQQHDHDEKGRREGGIYDVPELATKAQRFGEQLKNGADGSDAKHNAHGPAQVEFYGLARDLGHEFVRVVFGPIGGMRHSRVTGAVSSKQRPIPCDHVTVVLIVIGSNIVHVEETSENRGNKGHPGHSPTIIPVGIRPRTTFLSGFRVTHDRLTFKCLKCLAGTTHGFLDVLATQRNNRLDKSHR